MRIPNLESRWVYFSTCAADDQPVETVMFAVTDWIVILSYAYMGYSTWQGRNFYRRTVSYDHVVWC
jgi:hypothetical protein